MIPVSNRAWIKALWAGVPSPLHVGKKLADRASKEARPLPATNFSLIGPMALFQSSSLQANEFKLLSRFSPVPEKRSLVLSMTVGLSRRRGGRMMEMKKYFL